MAENTEDSAVPVSPETNNAEVKGKENVGVDQAVNRMLKIEQAKEAQANAKTDSILQAADAITEQPVEAAEASSVEVAEVPLEETTETADPALSHETETLDPKLQELVNKRIERRVAKEVAKRKILESQLNELKLSMQAQAQQPPSPQETVVPLPTGATPLANINDIAGLKKLRKEALVAKNWAQTHLDEGNDNVQLGDRLISEKELRTIVRVTNMTLERDIPERTELLEERAKNLPVAHQRYSFLTDKSSPAYYESQAILQSNPWMRELPFGDMWLGAITKESMAFQADYNKKPGVVKPTIKGIPPPSSQTAVSSSGIVSRVASGTRNQQEISAIRNSQSRKGGVTANEAIAALTKIEQLKTH